MRFEIHGVKLVRFRKHSPRKEETFHLSMASIYRGRVKDKGLTHARCSLGVSGIRRDSSLQ